MVFFRLIGFLLCWLLLLSSPFSGVMAQQVEKHTKDKHIHLTVGVTYDEKVPSMPKNPKFKGTWKAVTGISYASSTKTLRFNPKKVGFKTLIIHDSKMKVVAKYFIDVKKSDLNKVVREMQSLLGDIEGIQIKIINNRVVIDGQVLLPKDMSRIYSVIKQYGNKVASSLVTISPLAQKKIAMYIERDINNPEITVRAVNDKFILEGVAKDKDEKNRAVIIAKTYVPDVVVEEAVADELVQKRKVDTIINLIKLKPAGTPPPKKIIQLVVHYVELSKDYTKGFRFQWTPELGDGSKLNFRTSGGRSPTGGVINEITGTISNLLPKLNWAKQHGHARVLESSSMIVQDETPGTLNSGSGVPYQVVDGGQVGTAFKDVGLNTTITPKILGPRSDSISLKIEFQISALTGYVDQGPLISNRMMKTAIVVRSGQSAAVGGLISNSSGTDYNKLPKNVGENPLISLYSSKSFRRKQSQFVVFITPIIKSSASAGSDKIKQKFRLQD